MSDKEDLERRDQRERSGYDELLDSRVKQLREIHDRLTRIKRLVGVVQSQDLLMAIGDLLTEIVDAVRVAEEESAAF